MALIRKSDLKKMSPPERITKLKELRLEIVTANVTAKKATAKTKEIKRAIARLTTLMNQQTQEALTK